MAGRLTGKVALITGAARGQGAAEARLFAAEGAAVIAADVLDTEGSETAAAIDGATYFHLDVASVADWDRVLADVIEQHGRIDVLINNAGILTLSTLLTMDLDEYRRVIDVNQIGVFLGLRAVAPHMVAAESGAIVNISSIAGMAGGWGNIAYTASKWAVRGMTKSAARELGPHGVRVNSIHPGVIDTPMIHAVPGVDAGGLDPLIARTPMRRVAEPEEIAALALFLASDESSFCSGAEFVADGGMIA